MSKKDYTILGQKVTEEVYKEYYKMDRRRRYLEEDIKFGSSQIDEETGRVIFKPSKEDSLQRLSDVGVDFVDEQAVEDIVMDKATLLILQEALKELDSKDQELIRDIYYKEKTTREIAKENNVSQPAIVKRHKKIIDKLKKYFS
jgi:RNA polymerase sigma factor (sigma-70 family)